MLSCAVTLQKEASWKMELTAVFVISATEKSTCHNVRPCHVCPLNQTTHPGSTETAATLLFYQPSDLCVFSDWQLDSNRQPGAHTLMVRERLSDWTIKKIPSVQQGALLGMKRADAWSAGDAKQADRGGGGGRQNGCRGVPETLTILTQAWWSSFRGESATCYSLCDTNNLHYTPRHWGYGPSLSRASLTH